MSATNAGFSYIDAVELENPGRKTRRWELHAQDGGLLGFIEWLGRWRCYTFRPATSSTTWFEQTCLREIATFIESETKARRANRAAQS